MEKKIIDSQLGTILLRTHPRARRYSLKISGGQVVAIMPTNGNEQILLNFLEEKRDKLQAMLKVKENDTKILDENSTLQTTTFRLHIFRSERDNFYLSLKNGILHIACPQATDFGNEKVQQILHRLLYKALQYEAKRVLPGRLEELAIKWDFHYNTVKIKSSKSRWGSCSTDRNINLSWYLMLLPFHLIDYVLLHELCHTVEMNHSERFWSLMNSVTANKAKILRKELKQYPIP